MSGQLTRTVTLSLTVTAPVAPDFSLSVSPSSLSVLKGSSGSATVTVAAYNGFNGNVALSASGLPSGATATLTPSSVTGSGTSQLAIATTASTPTGTYTVTAKGVSGQLTRTVALSLTVTADQLATLLPPPIPQSTGPTYYVATTGSDSNPGTLSSPWRTIQKALNTLKPGEQAHVRGGTYVQSVVMTRAGTSSAPITVRAYPGEKPIIQPGGNNSMDYPVRITAGAAWFRMSGFIVEKAPLDTTVNVYISDGQKAQPYAAHDIEFSYNEVRNGKGTGLLVAPRTNNVQLIGNLVHDNGLGTQHQHQGLYFQGQNGLIANNVVYNQPHGFGIQVRGEDTDIYANNIIVVGNTSVGNQLAGFVVENTAGNVKLINNISAFNGTYGIHAYYCCGSTAPGNEAYNNILFGNPSGPTRVNGTIIDFSKGNTVADPLLADRSQNNYHLKPASPALGKSLPAYTPTKDADTKARPQGGGPDIGAYEG